MNTATETTSEKLAKVLRQVDALLKQADHQNTSPTEADTFRNKAEAMMFKYRIDETMLTAAEKAQMGINVQWLDMDVCESSNEFRQFYYELLRAIIGHMECRADFIRTVGRKTGDILAASQRYEGGTQYVNTISICGFESDLNFIQAMWNTVRIAFGARLEPKYDQTVSEQVNAYLMRSAGMEGWRIAQAIYGKTDKSLRPKVRKMFEAEAIKRGEDPAPLLGRGSNMQLFRESYASGFVSEYRYRLSAMRAARAQGETGLVLANRKDQIDEAFYTRFPDRRPQPVQAIGEHKYGTCAKCAKTKSGYCAEHRWMRPSQARSKVRYANDTAYGRGQQAARTVDVGGVKGRELG